MEFQRERVAVREAFGDVRSSFPPTPLSLRKMDGIGDEHPPIPAPEVVVENGSRSERGVAERRGGGTYEESSQMTLLFFAPHPPPFLED